jgi:hypothetical protein
MPWPNYEAFWEEKKKKKETQPKKVWVNIEFPFSRNDSLQSISSFLEVSHIDQLVTHSPSPQNKVNDPEYSDVTPLRRHGTVKPKVDTHLLTQLQVPLLPKSSDKHNHRDALIDLVSPRTSTTIKRRLSMGSDSDQYSDHGDDESLVDDDSLASLQNQQQEVYEQMWLSISPLEGYLSFQRVQHPQEDVIHETSIKEQSPPRINHPPNDENKMSSSASSFELTSTHVQSQKDQMDKLRLDIRRACLKVAAESYRSANVDVPDVSVLYYYYYLVQTGDT